MDVRIWDVRRSARWGRPLNRYSRPWEAFTKNSRRQEAFAKISGRREAFSKNSRPREAFTDVYVRIFWRSYSNTSWEITREIEEEKWNFKTPFTHILSHFWAKNPKSKLKYTKTDYNLCFQIHEKVPLKWSRKILTKIKIRPIDVCYLVVYWTGHIGHFGALKIWIP